MTNKKHNNKKGGKKNRQVEQQQPVEEAPKQTVVEDKVAVEAPQQQETEQQQQPEVAPSIIEAAQQEPAPSTYAEAAQEAEKQNVEIESKPQVVVAEPEEEEQQMEEPSGTGVAVPENPAAEEESNIQSGLADFEVESEPAIVMATSPQQEEQNNVEEEETQSAAPTTSSEASEEQSLQPQSQQSAAAAAAVPYEVKHKQDGKLFEGIPAIPRFFLLCIAVCVSLYIRTVFITLPKFFLKASFYIPNRIRLFLTPILLQLLNDTILPLAKDLYAKAKVVAKDKLAAGLEWAKPKLQFAFLKAASLYQRYHLQDKLKFLLKKLVEWTRTAFAVYNTVSSTYLTPALEFIKKAAQTGFTKASAVYTVLLARTTFLRAQVATLIQFVQERIIPVVAAVKKYVDAVMESLSKFIAEGYQATTKVIANVKFLQLPFLASSAPESVSQQ